MEGFEFFNTDDQLNKFNKDEVNLDSSITKKKNPTEILESIKDPSLEIILAGHPGKEMEDISQTRSRDFVHCDEKRLKEIADENNGKYRLLHNHPRTEEDLNISHSLPYPGDLLSFMIEKGVETSRVAQQDPQTGKVAGYYIVRKTKETPQIILEPTRGSSSEKKKWVIEHPVEKVQSDKFWLDIENYEKLAFLREEKQNPEALAKGLQIFADEYKLQIRIIPRPGYLYKEGIGFIKK